MVLCVHRLQNVFKKYIKEEVLKNQKYKKIHYKFMSKFNKVRARIKDSNDIALLEFSKCPSCGQKIRVPKGKGRISIHVPSCHRNLSRKHDIY
ncbi:MAG: hypothetical protein ACLR7D_15555 [Lachnospira eligens]